MWWLGGVAAKGCGGSRLEDLAEGCLDCAVVGGGHGHLPLFADVLARGASWGSPVERLVAATSLEEAKDVFAFGDGALLKYKGPFLRIGV